KLGGTSVKTLENIKKVISIVKDINTRVPCIVVVSALGGLTDLLHKTASHAASADPKYLKGYREIEKRHHEVLKKLLPQKKHKGILNKISDLVNELEDLLKGIFMVKELSPKSLDYILSFGEQLSSLLIYEAFIYSGINIKLINAIECIKTDNDHGNIKVDFAKTNKLLRKAITQEHRSYLMGGFISSSENGDITTLGRGGSDYTASIVAAALHASELQIWTDVRGVLTADPVMVEKAFPIERLSYEEAMELSHFGAKVIYPPTIQPVLNQKIPIKIKNTFEPSARGTLISMDSSIGDKPITGISSIKDMALITVKGSGLVGVLGMAKRIFGTLAKHNININLISQASSEHSISIALSPGQAEKAKAEFDKDFNLEIRAGLINAIEVEYNLAIIAIVGKNMRHTPGISGKLFNSLGRNGINIIAIAQGSSELNISVVIKNDDLKKALNVIHEDYFLSQTKVLNIFLAGLGIVGKTLFDQINSQKKALLKNYGIDLRLIGLANSKNMAIEENGINAFPKVKLSRKNAQFNVGRFVDKMIGLNYRNSIFVDCSAHDAVAKEYEKVLERSISVVTPNKLAASGPFDKYLQLKNLAQKRNVKYLFETNVGAGLPVLSTLNDLLRSGDRITNIEAVLSGSLNFIFNTISDKVSFYDAVNMACEKGFAEPDPRIDLSCMDVARKILILSREAGDNVEINDVKINSFLPDSCKKTASINDFMQKLKKEHIFFEKVRMDAESDNKHLRVVASYNKGDISVSLKQVSSDHPFYNMEGSDNIVLFKTKRYSDQPLVIKGSGAGPEVTAAGVFADIIRISNI
ncbi:MAG TPA: bifunctional aspartate kinase/homoserine dehydrogenase I, partial [Bacteroidetes bacterium]|nr:bifunctional aspartate kinase/homoserine dehydrogenase I [Bacteroidota bacterium]